MVKPEIKFFFDKNNEYIVQIQLIAKKGSKKTVVAFSHVHKLGDSIMGINSIYRPSSIGFYLEKNFGLTRKEREEFLENPVVKNYNPVKLLEEKLQETKKSVLLLFISKENESTYNYLKDYIKEKATIIEKWVNYNTSNNLLLCGMVINAGAPKLFSKEDADNPVNMSSYTLLGCCGTIVAKNQQINSLLFKNPESFIPTMQNLEEPEDEKLLIGIGISKFREKSALPKNVNKSIFRLNGKTRRYIYTKSHIPNYG
jgi:hypothetical protein